MSFGSKHARKVVKFEFDGSGIKEYVNMSHMPVDGKVYMVRALWISEKGKFGPRPMLTSDTFHLNLPAFMLSEVKAMIDDPEDVADINAGRAAFKVVTRTGKQGNQYKAIEWCDPEDLPF